MVQIKEIEDICGLETFIGSKSLSIITFTASWCAPCKEQISVIESLEAAKKVKFASIDVDKLEALASFYKITNIPVLVFFKDGKELSRTIGVKNSEELMDLIKNLK